MKILVLKKEDNSEIIFCQLLVVFTIINTYLSVILSFNTFLDINRGFFVYKDYVLLRHTHFNN